MLNTPMNTLGWFEWRRHVRWLSIATCLVGLTLTGPSPAQDTPDDLARRHFESGEAYFKVSDYDNALREFTRAYDLSKRPEILLSIATVQERMAKLGEAIGRLEQYLAEAPEGRERETVRIRVENLKKRLANEPEHLQTGAPDAGAALAAPPPPTSASPAAPTTPPPGASSTPPSAPPSAPAPEARQGSNLPALVALGIGGLSAVGAVVTGILAKSKYDTAQDECSPHCTDDQLSGTRTMAWTSTVLTGVAVVGAGVGVTLLLTSSRSAESPATARLPAPRLGLPQVTVGLGPLGAQASAGWRF
jgi:hypothetical protein